MTAPIESNDELPTPRGWAELAAELGYDGVIHDEDEGNGNETANFDDGA